MNKLDTLIAWHRAGYQTLIPWTNRKAAVRRPLIKGWLTACPSEATLIEQHNRWPLADWAYLPTGGVVVLDLEMKNYLNGAMKLNELYLQYKDVSCDTMRIGSYSGGFHFYFRSQQPIVGGWSLAPGIEIKAESGSVHMPASQGYVQLSDLRRTIDLPYLPLWLERLLVEGGSRQRGRTVYDVPRYTEGERRQKLCSMAGALRNIGLTEPELIASLRAVAATRCDGVFPDDELLGIAKDYATKQVGTVGLALSGDPSALSAVQLAEKMGMR